MAKQEYGTKEDIERMIKETKGDNAGIYKAARKKATPKKSSAKKKK